MVELISARQFNQIIKEHDMVVVDFFAQWCGPCQMMHPIVEELANKYRHIKFVKLDIDESINVAIDQKVQVVPTFVAYKNGTEINRIIGYNQLQDFALFLKGTFNI